MRTILAAFFSLTLCVSASDQVPVKRQPPKLPPLVAKPLYGVIVFGANSGHPVWAVLDKSDKAIAHYDVLYLDLNADGDATQEGERFSGVVKDADSDPSVRFELPRLKEPGSGREHTAFAVVWRPTRVSASIKWLGDKITNAGYGTELDKYGNFASSPDKAPVYVLGHELPFQFQHWTSGSLNRGGETDFRVFMGNPGEGQGAFCAVDQDFLPASDYVVATVIYKSESGEEVREKFNLKDRC
ncbi:MAG TPA: hypothetical protein VG796_00610 [Verrucomicrobiales bacterium]|nr:hypothetical protein [Verrucomicrobiales bacterium]